MRVLFFGTTEGTACALHYFTSLIRLGHQVVPFDPHYYTTSGPLERLRVRMNRGPTAARVRGVSDNLIALCRANAFELVFVVAENFLEKNTMDAIRRECKNPPLFLFHSHDNVFSDGIHKPRNFSETLAAYDFVFTTKSQNVERYRSLGQSQAYFVPSAYEPTVHRPIPPGESRLGRDFEATFVGTYDRSRIDWCEAAGWNRLHVWGGLWQRFPDFAKYRDRIHPNPVYYFEFADIMSRSRAALGFLREEADDLHTQRTFEIPACGALQVAPRNEEILSFFEEDKEIVCFSSKEELREKLDHYLKRPEAAQKIARRGYERCLRDGHRYQDRVGEMIERVQTKPLTRSVAATQPRAQGAASGSFRKQSGGTSI